MAYYPSPRARKIMTLIDNARQLAVDHQQRTPAKSVIEACSTYAKTLGVETLSGVLSNLSQAVINKSSAELTEIFEDAQRVVIKDDMVFQSRR